MEVRRLDDPVAFLDAAGPILLEDEARHNLVLGIAGTLRDHPSLYPEEQVGYRRVCEAAEIAFD